MTIFKRIAKISIIYSVVSPLNFIAYDYANAECMRTPFNIGSLSTNPVYQSPATITDGSTCSYRFSINNGSIENGSIVKKPKNGDLLVINAYSIDYTPKKGFKGKDNYSIKFCGIQFGEKGCVTVETEATIK